MMGLLFEEEIKALENSLNKRISRNICEKIVNQYGKIFEKFLFQQEIRIDCKSRE